MYLKIVLLVSVASTLTVAAKTEDPSFVHSKFLVPCNHTENPGASCLDCNRRLICTAIGGIILPCWLPGANCVNDGRCSSEPSEECAPSTNPTPPPTPTPTTRPTPPPTTRPTPPPTPTPTTRPTPPPTTRPTPPSTTPELTPTYQPNQEPLTV